LLVPDARAGDFDRPGNLFYAVKRESAQWKLLTVEVGGGQVLRSVAIDEPANVVLYSASFHPDGKRLALSRNETRFDIWMLEGLPHPETGWMRLFRHWREP
jgi:hypothetical protein